MTFKMLLTAAAVAAVTSSASAAVIDVVGNGFLQGARGTMNVAELIGDDNDARADFVQFDFSVKDDIIINDFAVSANGGSGGSDVRNIRFGFDSGTGMQFDDVQTAGGVTTGDSFLSGRSFSAGSMFSFFFNEFVPGLNAQRAFVDITFVPNKVTPTETPTPSPVPLPAGGLLLLSAIGAGGLAARAKKVA